MLPRKITVIFNIIHVMHIVVGTLQMQDDDELMIH